MTDPRVFDKEELIERMMGDEELAREILAEYVADMPRQIRTLREAFAERDDEASLRLSHTIKGASANVGAPALKAIAFEMETACRAGAPERASKRMTTLEEGFGRLRQTLLREGMIEK